MLVLLVLLFLLWAGLMGLLTAWSIWFQGYLYTEPSTGLVWRGPVAGTAIAFVALLWVLMDYNSPGHYRPLWEFSSTEESKPVPEIHVGKDTYKLRPGPGNKYTLNGLPSGKQLPSRPVEFVVVEGDQKALFKAERDEKGNFKERKSSSIMGQTTEPLRYYDDSGRVMYEGSLGRLSSFRGGWFVGNVLLNLLFFAACFLSLWMIVRFQWPHALGQAVVLWLALLLFVMPGILTKAEQVGESRAGTARTS